MSKVNSTYPSGWVYLLLSVSPEGDESHKIGITTSTVEKRIKQLQTGNPNKIQILRQYRTINYRKVEKALHKRFKCFTESKNEWRKLSDDEVFNFIPLCEGIDDNIKFLLENNSFYK
jgi:hypothetical protein